MTSKTSRTVTVHEIATRWTVGNPSGKTFGRSSSRDTSIRVMPPSSVAARLADRTRRVRWFAQMRSIESTRLEVYV